MSFSTEQTAEKLKFTFTDAGEFFKMTDERENERYAGGIYMSCFFNADKQNNEQKPGDTQVGRRRIGIEFYVG